MTLSIVKQCVAGIFIVWPSADNAQQLCELGIAGGVFAKTDVVEHTGKLGSALMRSGVDAVLKINGQDERAMSFMQQFGLAVDNTSYKLDKGHNIVVSSYCVNIGSSVLIHSKWEKLHYNLGIGVLLRVDGDVTDKYNNYSVGSTTIPHVNVDTVYDQLIKRSRTVIPYISVGLVYDIDKRFSAQLSLEETLINFYEPDSKISYYVNYNPQYISVNYQPLYIGVKVFYKLWY